MFHAHFDNYFYSLLLLILFTIYHIKIENIKIFLDNVENVSLNGHFIPPLPTESVPMPPPPPSESFQSITEDSDSQSQELPSTDSVVCF